MRVWLVCIVVLIVFLCAACKKAAAPAAEADLLPDTETTTAQTDTLTGDSLLPVDSEEAEEAASPDPLLQDAADAEEAEALPDADTAYYVTIEDPVADSPVVIGNFGVSIKTNCKPLQMQFSDNLVYNADSISRRFINDAWYWDFWASFKQAGADQQLTVTVTGEQCSVSASVLIDVQPKAETICEEEASDGTPYTICRANQPTVAHSDFVIFGSDATHTLEEYGALYTEWPLLIINGGPAHSYWQGDAVWDDREGNHHGRWESDSGNPAGRQACLVFKTRCGKIFCQRNASIELSYGRDPITNVSLFTEGEDVLCAGPQLVEKGKNVAAEHYISEHSELLALEPDTRIPRSAACITAEGSVVVTAILSKTVRYGMTLEELADYLIAIGCVDAINLAGDNATAFWTHYGNHFCGTEPTPVYNTIVFYAVENKLLR